MALSEDELRAVLTRAAEIQHSARPDAAELQRFIASAEQAGYKREAIERALRERFGVAESPPAPGALALAQAGDGKYRVARVLSHSSDSVRVQFLKGGERDVAIESVRQLSLSPGERVSVVWPAWGTWSCEVIAYDAQQGMVMLSDRWGSERTFPISDVWVTPPSALQRNLGAAVMLVGAGVIAGGILTAIIARLLLP